MSAKNTILNEALRIKQETLDSYYQQARDWGYDKYESIRVSRNRHMIVAIFALIIAAVAVASVAMLAPLKTVEHYILEVNRNTGEISEMKKLESANFTLDKAVTEHFFARYLQVCEGYDYKVVKENFEECQILSGPQVQNTYVDYMKGPNSPIAKLKQNTQRTVYIQTIIPIPNTTNQVQVRYTTTDKNANYTDATYHWVAIMDYKWGMIPEEENLRNKNRAGFRIMSFKKDQELINEHHP